MQLYGTRSQNWKIHKKTERKIFEHQCVSNAWIKYTFCCCWLCHCSVLLFLAFCTIKKNLQAALYWSTCANGNTSSHRERANFYLCRIKTFELTARKSGSSAKPTYYQVCESLSMGLQRKWVKYNISCDACT